MIHTEKYEFFKEAPVKEEWIKRQMVIRIINKIPMSELEKFVHFEEVETKNEETRKLIATIELIDV